MDSSRAYARLLRLYPRPFRERYAEGMQQTFHDLCREHKHPLPLALWVYSETLLAIIKEHTTHMNDLTRMTLRVVLGAFAVWMIPVIAAQFVPDWHWGIGGFIRVYFVFFATGMAIALISRRMGAWSYKAAVALAGIAGLTFAWSNMVQMADSENPAMLWYFSVIVLGAIGAAIARLKAPGLSKTLFGMAGTLAVLSLLIPVAPPITTRAAIGHVVYVALFTASGLLFRRAAATSRA